jgi:hypothetical protein
MKAPEAKKIAALTIRQNSEPRNFETPTACDSLLCIPLCVFCNTVTENSSKQGHNSVNLLNCNNVQLQHFNLFDVTQDRVLKCKKIVSICCFSSSKCKLETHVWGTLTCNALSTGWCRETVKFEIIRNNEGNLQNFIWSWKCVLQECKFH